ncbi:unnamed protein product [Adineta steineri]|uniref:G-protein coupled receptors family 1 profile domain-containing protein n=1 Tax=Adineta steineri TaxID=433720 RepID=A0A815BBX8_9BILA|nr:unnamed protein product [Adineta steineri]CAF3889084.1 unnamed protein product [Adineta steineri]
MQINRYGPTFMIVFGTFSNILNICVLRERSLKKIPCTIYLCWSSISAVVFIWSGLLTRTLQGYNINWPNENQAPCKIRLYLLNISWAVAIWALVGANIDRFLCSHHSVIYRQLSTSQLAKRFLMGIFTFFAFVFIEIYYCVEAKVPNVPVACYGRNLPCRVINDWVYLGVDIILPSIIISIFGTLTIRNARLRIVRPITNLIHQITTTKNNIVLTRRNDRNLTHMLFIQVSFVFVLDLPFGIYRSYASLTANLSKSQYRVAVENLIYALIVLLVYFTHSTSFYIYTLTGKLYRATFERLRRHYFNFNSI